MRRVDFLPISALDCVEETLDIVGHRDVEVFGDGVNEFAPALPNGMTFVATICSGVCAAVAAGLDARQSRRERSA